MAGRKVKAKTNKSVAKRVKITASGKIMRRRTFSGCGHILEKKSPKRIRRFRKSALISKSDFKRIKKLLPYKF